MTDINDFDQFSAPDSDVVLQEETADPAIPVRVVDMVRTDEMPTTLTACRNILLPAGTRAIKLLSRDPRRKRAIVWPALALDTELSKVILAPTESEANAFSGAILDSFNAARTYEFTFVDEAWVRPCIIFDTAGLASEFRPTLMDSYISVINESWSR